MATAEQIQQAIHHVKERTTFLQGLLADTLEWPIPEQIEAPQELGYGWTPDDLRAQGLDEHLLDGQIWQIQLRHQQPWGIFVVEFAQDRVYRTVLRQVLRGLVPSRRRAHDLPAWQHENLLFLCVTRDYQRFTLAHFRGDKAQTARLATFGWQQGDRHLRTLCEFNLKALAWPEDGGRDAAAWLKQWAGAFDVEVVTKRFFAEYHAVFEQVEAAVKGVPVGEPRRLYVQRLFNRLMFLYFIQRKGWLSFQGDHHYLRALFSAAVAAREDFLNDRLYWTFFSGLNTLMEQEALQANVNLVERRGTVPFLNGGLFDLEDEYDIQGKVKIPNAAFATVFDLFERYNFTVTESTPFDIEVAVDPEMLGKVFEELVTGRHESGSYYTPRPIVAFMCREALKHYLAPTGGDATAVARFVDEGDSTGLHNPEAVLNALRAVTVCDPACGSGAYLLGMMQELLRLRAALFAATRLDAVTVYNRKLEIIQNNLYGVDIDVFAVNIAKLRLWLSLAIDYEGKKPPPLPNLDFKIECGDSLTAPDPQEIPDLFRSLLVASADRLAELKGQYLQTYGKEKKKFAEHINAEEAILRESLHENLAPGSVDWRVAFAEVFRNRGFDIVVANPPYVSRNSLRKRNPELVDTLRSLYGTAKSRAFDLFGCFVERGVGTLKAGGTLSFIVPSGWYTGSGFEGLRRFVATHTDPLAFVNLPYDIFAAAWVDTTIFITSRRAAPTGWPRKTSCIARLQSFEKREQIAGSEDFDRDYSLVDISTWFTTGSDLFLTRADSTVVCLMRKIETNSCLLGEVSDIQRGVTPFHLTEKSSGPRFKPAFAGTVRRYFIDRGPLRFLKFDETLAEFKPERYFTGPRILLRELISRQFRLQSTYTEEDFVTNKSMQSILPKTGGPEMKFLLGCINSSLLSWVFLQRSNVAHRDDFPKIVLKETRQLPIAKPTREQQSQMVRLVDRILVAKRRDAEADVKELEREIDLMVYDLYGLTEDERAIVEEAK